MSSVTSKLRADLADSVQQTSDEKPSYARTNNDGIEPLGSVLLRVFKDLVPNVGNEDDQ